MKNIFIILSQLEEDWHPPEQAVLSLASKKQQKPQISSISGISPKQRNRYRVMVGEQILGERLTIDEALKLAKGGER